MRRITILIAFLIPSCTSTIDSAGDRIDRSIDKLAERVEQAGIKAIDRSSERMIEVVDHALDRVPGTVQASMEKSLQPVRDTITSSIETALQKLSATIDQVIKGVLTSLQAELPKMSESLGQGLVAGLKKGFATKATETIGAGLPEEEKKEFAKEVEEKGLGATLKNWALELILVGIFGNGSAVVAWIRARRKSKLNQVVLDTVVASVETSPHANEIKERVRAKVKSSPAEFVLRGVIKESKKRVTGQIEIPHV